MATLAEDVVTPLHARMAHPAMVVPDAMAALQAVGAAIGAGGVAPRTLELVHVRASQINGCSVCLDGHRRIAMAAGETDDRLFVVAAWRDAPNFTDAERAALALTEALTRLSDRADPVPDAIWNEAARNYNELELATLVLAIANINVWNRLNIATRQVAGGWAP
jgi:AhpD family alkylhydroperoxidase